jgi:hypothetical protein
LRFLESCEAAAAQSAVAKYTIAVNTALTMTHRSWNQ